MVKRGTQMALAVFFGKTRLIDNRDFVDMKQFDFLVLGSGIAGLSFALKVARARARGDHHQEEPRGIEHQLCPGRHRGGHEQGRFLRNARARHARSRARACARRRSCARSSRKARRASRS